jgi:hypothetical protein
MTVTANQDRLERHGLARRKVPTSAIVIFGIALPIVCFAIDLMLGQIVSQYAPWGLWSIAAIGIVAIALSFCRWSSVAMRSILVGILAATGSIAGLIGLLLFPLSIVGILMAGIGLLGFAPFLTSYVFLGRARQIYHDSACAKLRWIVVGAAIGASPLFFQLGEWWWISSRLNQLRGDEYLAEQALRELANYPFRLGRGERDICIHIDKLLRGGEGIRRELTRILGPDRENWCGS